MADNTGETGSQGSSHFALQPVSAAVLAQRERKRRDEAGGLGAVGTGCPELDDYTLLGGLERGSVVGMSAEEESFGLLVALQAVARSLVRGDSRGGAMRAMVITTQPVHGVLVVLRDAIRRQLEERSAAGNDFSKDLRACLERVSVSRVFDLEGLWEVLEDLDTTTEPNDKPREAEPVVEPAGEAPGDPVRGQSQAKHGASPELGDAVGEGVERPLSPILLPELKPRRHEVADSEDEEELSSVASSPLSSPPASSPREEVPLPVPADDTNAASGSPPARTDARQQQHPQPQMNQPLTEKSKPTESSLPDIIVITHFSAILTTLFTHREKTAAHTALQLLSSHLRYLSRNLPSSPLVIILNSTASSTSSTRETANPRAGDASGARRSSEKHLDPSLRSIFNPPPLDVPGYRYGAASRRNKPSFGLVFTQLLDLHLLCTRIPRDAEDAERLYAPAQATDGLEVRYVWAVEVLLDEMGVWETREQQMLAADSGRKTRRSREQRWGVVHVVGGRVVNAFEPETKRVYGDIRLAAGFGGPRV